jgi:cytochrome c2
MRRRGILFGLSVLALLLVSAGVDAQSDDVAEGKALYLDNCSGCHGLIASRSSLPPAAIRVAWTGRAGAILTGGPAGIREHRGDASPGPARTEALWLKPGTRLAVAPPYGPSLRGVYGRLAGTVADFLYSRDFRRTLEGVVWNRDTLDIWIKDSQAWVPGSLMFYTQPDPEIRRKIITYLSVAR